MEFQDVVRKRKMVRSFEDRPIPHESVERILANARRAPSAGFSQGWGFLVLVSAVDAGLGAVFFGVFDQAKLRATFAIPDEYTAVGVIAVGYPKPTDRPSPSLKRGHRAAAEVVRRGNWRSSGTTRRERCIEDMRRLALVCGLVALLLACGTVEGPGALGPSPSAIASKLPQPIAQPITRK